MNIKTTTQFVKSITGRSVTGIFAVHGNVDDGDDRSWPGSFSKTISERKDRIRFLWQHNFDAPPIATITSLREVARAELPPEVLAKAPEAMGGVEVVREYLNTARADEVLEGIKSGAIGEMSYAYDAVKFDFEEKPDAKYEWDQIRNLREVRLHEVSDVLWGMNPATQGSKTALSHDLSWVVDYLAHCQKQRAKAGARHSGPDLDLINSIATNALALGATNIKLITDSPDESGASTNDAGKNAEPPSRNDQAAPVAPGFNFAMAFADLMALQLATLE